MRKALVFVAGIMVIAAPPVLLALTAWLSLKDVTLSPGYWLLLRLDVAASAFLLALYALYRAPRTRAYAAYPNERIKTAWQACAWIMVLVAFLFNPFDPHPPLPNPIGAVIYLGSAAMFLLYHRIRSMILPEMDLG